MKLHFGDCVINRATKCTANIVKLQRFRTGARKKEGYISGAWGDTEKL